MWGWVRRIFSYVLIYSYRAAFRGVCGRYWCFELFWSKSVLSWMLQWHFIGVFPCPSSKYVVFNKKLKTFNLDVLAEQKGASLRPQWGICLPSVSCLSKCPCPNCMCCGKLLHGALNTLSAVANRQELFSVLLPKIHSLVMKENSDMKYRTAKPPGWQHEPRELWTKFQVICSRCSAFA